MGSPCSSTRTGESFSAQLTLTNSGRNEMRTWKLTLRLGASITGLWNGELRREGSAYEITPLPGALPLGPGESVQMGFNGKGALTSESLTECRLNGETCEAVVTALVPPVVSAQPIAVDGEPAGAPYRRLALERGSHTYRLRSRNASAFRAISNNPSVASASISGDTLTIAAVSPGRASIRIDDTASSATRILGVRVNQPDGKPPGLPPYVSIGSVSEDSGAHLDFWGAIEPGSRNKFVDIRYIYLNGGPVNGWDTWGTFPGSRAVQFIRNSHALGMIPFFVFYNIPDGGESYETDLRHVQSPAYMSAYFANLRMFLEIVERESPGEIVGIILEPDFLGYMAQNAGRPASGIAAMVRGAYDTGVLTAADPKFPDTVKGLVEAINYTIQKYAPQAYFGWQINLWAAPPGGYTTPVPVRGIMHADPSAIPAEAAAIAQYYLDAGVTSHGAGFFSIDKYGLDAAGFEPKAAADPASSIWFWNSDQWHNYLAFTRAASTTLGLPAVLWQLPVGRINSSLEPNPYALSGRFANLANTFQSYEDSAPAFFFGDTFTASGVRFEHFSANLAGDEGLRAASGEITWAPHIAAAARAGVTSILFGAGVGVSTNSVGGPPTDGYWWVTKTQRYLARPVYLDSAPKLTVESDWNFR